METYAEKIFDIGEVKCEQPCRQYVIIGMLWLLWLAIFSMNYVAYFHDYSRYSDEQFIMGMTFRSFSLLAGIITISLDALTLWGLLGNTPFFEQMSTIARIILVGIVSLGGFIVVMYTHFVSVPGQMKDENKEKDPVLSTKFHRVVLYVMILIVDVVMVFMQFSYDRNALEYIGQAGGALYGSVDMLGGCQAEGSSFGNIFGLIFGLGGIVADILAIRTQALYDPELYKLPKHFD